VEAYDGGRSAIHRVQLISAVHESRTLEQIFASYRASNEFTPPTGTRDGAKIEMAAQAGEENFFLFGLTAQQVADSRGWYNPQWHYEHEPETREALDLISSDYFSRNEPGVFEPLRDALLTHDYYMHLADLKS